MKMNDFVKKTRVMELPLGTSEVVFKRIDYRIDDDQNVTGAFIHIEGFKPLYIPVFEEANYQLDFLLEQLDVVSYDPTEINKKAGTTIIAQRYQRNISNRTYTNVTFDTRTKNQSQAVELA